MHIEVKIVKDHEDAIIPKYQSEGAAGFDLHSVENVILFAGETKIVSTGLRVEIPEEYELQIRPRSGSAAKNNINVLNSPGTIDSDYRGIIKVILHNHSMIDDENEIAGNFTIRKGDRIAQGVISPVIQAKFKVVEAKDLSDTERGVNGLGSTGSK